jgi:hypothetical protein
MPRRIASEGWRISFFTAALASSVNVLFGLIKLANLMEIRFYYYYSPKVVNITILSPSTDFWVWMVSLLFTLGTVILIKILRRKSLPRWTMLPFLLTLVSLAIFTVNETTAYLFTIPLGFIMTGILIYYGNDHLVTNREEAASLTLIFITSVLILFEVASLSSWIFNIFDYETPFMPTPRWIFPQIDLQMFNLLYPLTSWLFLLFLYSWIWIPALKRMLSGAAISKRTHTRFETHSLFPIPNTDSKHKLDHKYVALGLLLCLATAAFIAYYPYTHAPSSTLVGADSAHYYNRLNEMSQKGPLVALDSDRPFAYLLMYFVQQLSGSPPETTVIIMPVILAVCLSLAVFWFVRVGTKNELLALMASLFSSFSFQVTVGVFAYFVANWLAIVECFLMLVFLLKGFENNSWKYIIASALIGMAVLLTHPYTWDVLMAILVFYLAWIFVKRKPDRKLEMALLAVLLASNLVFYTAYSLTPSGKGVSYATGARDVTSGISISNFLNLQNGLSSMVQEWVGGILGNPLLLVLGVAGLFSLFDFKQNFNRIMLLWVLIPSLALLVVTPNPYYYRFIYLVPIQVQAAAGLYWILNMLEKTMLSFKSSEAFRVLKTTIVVLVVLFMLNYALRSVDEAIIHII